MRKLIVGLLLFVSASAARAQGDEQLTPVAEPTVAPRVQVGVAFLPMVLGKVATGPSGHSTSSNLDASYGVGLSIGYRILSGLSVGIAPQVVFHLSSKDYGGYPVIESEKEYDLMARIAYAYTVIPKLDIYAEVLPGYAIVTYNQIILGVQSPNAKGIVLGGGVGAAFAITDRLFVNAGVGYQLGFQKVSYIRDDDVKTKFLRIALGGGVKF